MLFVRYRFAVLMLMAYGYTSIFAQVLKRIFNTPRPVKFFEGIETIRVIEGYPIHQWKSFPSGHSVSSFALATVLVYLLPNKKAAWIILPLALLAAFSRVYLAQHF